jgi:hypothetical protein
MVINPVDPGMFGGDPTPPTATLPGAPAPTTGSTGNDNARFLGMPYGVGSPFQAADIGSRVGADGWWYDLNDGHRLSHEEATAREQTLSEGRQPYWGVGAVAGSATGDKPNTSGSAASGGISSAVPDGSTGPNNTYAGIAQTKYGAPPGWDTPAGQKSEGVIWTTPWGVVVTGFPPAVFTYFKPGMTATACCGALAAGAVTPTSIIPAYAQPLPQVTVTGVQPTSALPSWAIPAGIAALALVAVLFVTSKKG